MKESTREKFDSIKERLSGKRVVVAFSGGVDSSVLASITKEVAKQSILLLIKTQTMPNSEIKAAEGISKELAMSFITKNFDWLASKNLAENSTDRCLRCKRQLVELWKSTAEELGFDIIVEGTTISETKGYRPGIKALKNSGVLSPFLDACVTKEEIREYAREHGLSVAEKPSMACLATRFPYGTEITQEHLAMVEKVERSVSDLFGIECVRARYHGELVRIEVPQDDIPLLLDKENREHLVSLALNAGFSYVTLDLRGYRTGTFDEGLNT